MLILDGLTPYDPGLGVKEILVRQYRSQLNKCILRKLIFKNNLHPLEIYIAQCTRYILNRAIQADAYRPVYLPPIILPSIMHYTPEIPFCKAFLCYQFMPQHSVKFKVIATS
jgi:hypothetical protein